MFRFAFAFALSLGLLVSCTKDRFIITNPTPTPGVESIIYYWNFNQANQANQANVADISNPSVGIGSAEMKYLGIWDYAEGTLLNSIDGTTPGNSLRLRNPAGIFTMKISTLGYEKLKLSYAAMRTNSGAQENIFSYSLDGVNYFQMGIAPERVVVTTEFEVKTVDFSAVNALNNQSVVYIKIDFNLGHTNETGNNRFDNITFKATSL
jgi:hypothetical protein